jgi:NAD(P)-dependent dehydrogenase (short-subunit alcohol dehydrogenase family)
MQTIKKTLAENVKGGNKFAPGNTKFTLDDVPDLSSKVALVTGGSEGIGYGCTHTLLSHNISKLFILSTSEDVVDGALEAIRQEIGDSAASRVKWMQCDLTDWNAVGQIAFQIRKETDRLDILINNAGRGIMTQQMVNGIDRHMALNHMGHVVLTSHLLPLLKKTAEAGNTVRIVNQASNAHESAPKDTKFATVEELNTDYGAMALYGRSKLAAILYSKYLTRHLHSQYPQILINATHPGFVETKMSTKDIFEPYPLGGYAMRDGMKPFKKDQFEGAQSTMYAATVIEGSGEYICPPASVEKGSNLANDETLEENLMNLTREVVKQKTKSEIVDKGCPFTDS